MAALNRAVESLVTGIDLNDVTRRRAGFSVVASLLALAVFLLACAQSASAALLLPRDPARTIDLTTFSGKTFLQAVLEPNDGINAKTVADDATAVTISSTALIMADLATFNPKVANDLYFHFQNGQADFMSAAGHVAGQSLSPQQIQAAIGPFINPNGQLGAAKAAAANVILLTSGSGTVVELNADDYFYNVAYQSPNKSSGRNYAITSTRKLLDPSDTDYLIDVSNYLGTASSQQITDFYTTMFKVLTSSDTSGMTSLSSQGQVTLTDFLAIYTAEMMRHQMFNLDVTNNPYEIDVAEVTLLGAYISASGMVMDGGKLISGNVKAYSHNGSIGTHRSDFTKLAKLITAYENMKSHHKAMITSITNLTPVKTKKNTSVVKGDIFRRVLVYLDQPQFESGVTSNAAAITTAMVQLENQIKTDQAAITAYVLKHQ
jgi:hypothetical protein